MFERIVEIIVYVVSELRQNNDLAKLNLDELINQGYTSSEISTALSWIADRMEINDKYTPVDTTIQNNSFRVLHDLEKELFTKEAWGELITMNALGLITNEHIETLIDRAFMLGLRQIDLQQLKIFVANVVFNAQYNNLAGSRFMLIGNDTIN